MRIKLNRTSQVKKNIKVLKNLLQSTKKHCTLQNPQFHEKETQAFQCDAVQTSPLNTQLRSCLVSLFYFWDDHISHLLTIIGEAWLETIRIETMNKTGKHPYKQKAI